MVRAGSFGVGPGPVLDSRPMSAPSSLPPWPLEALLKPVSRSFYLSIRFLPRAMRRPIGLGYLLARASDTVADTTDLPAGERLRWLAALERAVAGFSPDPILGLAEALEPRQRHAGEKALLGQLPKVLEQVATLELALQDALREVIRTIISGQRWDVEHFELTPGSHAGVASSADLERYAWQVAGCVGVFWTRVGRHAGAGFPRSEVAGTEMLHLGRLYGQGLQLVNILRDLGEDLARGRCYLPRPALLAAGWRDDAGEMDGEAAREIIETAAAPWRRQAREWVGAGRAYARLLPRGRLRWATVLPALLAERTLDRLDQAGKLAITHRIKISRREVWRAAWDALWV